ncbi:alpha/beta fold hydrolase [Paraburkholderia caffeinilytica]|uniref:alpha/beta fold hydrolase n=1 Tax=Paraburkholderia caffeinilytica TaxID=1761016 RepID=UPI003DA0C06E
MPGSRSRNEQRQHVMHRVFRDGHHVAFTVAGTATGIPVVVLHGGPGSGSQQSVLQLFDLARFRVVLVDQRGAGASTPRGSLRHNRTAQLTGDLEAIRMRLGIERWGVMGGSWGASLALAYAGLYPRAVTGVVMRGLFLTSAREVRRLFGASRVHAPHEWKRLCAAAQCHRPSALLGRCATALQAGGLAARQRAVALAWRDYEAAVLASSHSRRVHVRPVRSYAVVRKLISKYRIQAHYLTHDCWLGERRLLSRARDAQAAGVPLFAVHGMRDPVCPPDNLRRLARVVPAVHVEWAHAGHLATEPELAMRMKRAIEAVFAPCALSADAAT